MADISVSTSTSLEPPISLDPSLGICANIAFLNEATRQQANQLTELQAELAALKPKHEAVKQELEDLVRDNNALFAQTSVCEAERGETRHTIRQLEAEFDSLEKKNKETTLTINQRRENMDVQRRMTSLYCEKMKTHDKQMSEREMDDPNFRLLDSIDTDLQALEKRHNDAQKEIGELLKNLGDFATVEHLDRSLQEKELRLSTLVDSLAEQEEKLEELTSKRKAAETRGSILKKRNAARVTMMSRRLEMGRLHRANLLENIDITSGKLADMKSRLGLPPN